MDGDDGSGGVVVATMAIVKVLCAWCEAEGRETVIDEYECGYMTGIVSHGICKAHFRQMCEEEGLVDVQEDQQGEDDSALRGVECVVERPVEQG